MLGSSSSPFTQYRLFQAYCGRFDGFDVLHNPGSVLSRWQHYDWLGLKQRLSLQGVYLLGLWDTTGPIIINEEQGKDLHEVPNRLPSAFAITDHTAINPLLGSLAEARSLFETLHQCGLEIWVDFVPNHTGVAHPWVTNHPDYYKSIDKTAFSGDVLELNYENQAVVREMKQILMAIADLGVDGVRCDMAHLIPHSFWQTAISEVVSSHPRFRFIAEAYSPSVFDLQPQLSLMEDGFEAVYDEPLYRNVRAEALPLALANVVGHMNFIKQCNSCHWVHYISNHDDGPPMNPDLTRLWQLLFSLLPGYQLFYNGTLWGLERRLAHHHAELLPETMYNPTMLPVPVSSWFNWLSLYQPAIIGEFALVQDLVVTVTWQSERGNGTCWFNFDDKPHLFPSGNGQEILSSSLHASGQISGRSYIIVHD